MHRGPCSPQGWVQDGAGSGGGGGHGLHPAAVDALHDAMLVYALLLPSPPTGFSIALPSPPTSFSIEAAAPDGSRELEQLAGREILYWWPEDWQPDSVARVWQLGSVARVSARLTAGLGR